MENKPKPKLLPVICLEKGKLFKNFMLCKDKILEVFSFEASSWSFYERKERDSVS